MFQQWFLVVVVRVMKSNGFLWHLRHVIIATFKVMSRNSLKTTGMHFVVKKSALFPDIAGSLSTRWGELSQSGLSTVVARRFVRPVICYIFDHQDFD